MDRDLARFLDAAEPAESPAPESAVPAAEAQPPENEHPLN